MRRWRDRRRLTRLEHLLGAATWILSGSAALVAMSFAWRYKPHVFWQTALGYGLLWALFAYYANAHRLHRRLLSLHIWLVAVGFAVLLCFVHLDDLPARLVYRDDGPTGPRMGARPDAPGLYWAVGFNVGWAVLFSVRALWLNWRLDHLDETDHSSGSNVRDPAISDPGSETV